MAECQCIYNAETHPACERSTATFLVQVAPTAPIALMCEWCALDWQRRHPSIEVEAV